MFSENSHVFKLKGMEHRAPCKYINCPNTHTLVHVVGSIGQNIFLKKVVTLHIKLRRMNHRASCKHIFCHYTYLWPLGGFKGKNIIFSQSSHGTYQIKGYGA